MLAITITFLGVLLAAGALAAERDENAIGRLVRGLVGLGQLVAPRVVGLRGARHAHDRGAMVERPEPPHLVERGNELPRGEVTGGAEDDEQARVGGNHGRGP